MPTASSIKRETAILKKHLAEHRLKLTRQRQVILETFLSKDHVTAEDLYREIIKRNVRVGLATVYRTLNLLCHCGLAQQRHFSDTRTLYDNVSNKDHHDHLICTRCGKIIEFENSAIERLQEMVARKNKFAIYNHKLELYGLCRDCHG
jgi:Fur family ferric uptake transcriptional regulator